MALTIGSGVKYYEEAHHGFGRQDARVVRIDAGGENIIDLRTVQTNRRINNVHNLSDIAEGNNVDSYWVILPEDYVPGSEGH